MSLFASNRIQSRVTRVLYHFDNPLPGTSAAVYWRQRATTQLPYRLSLAEVGAIDMGLAFYHNLTIGGAPLNLTASIVAFVDTTEAGGSVLNGQYVWQGLIPTDARFLFIPEKGTGEAGTSTRKIIEIPEFRQPIDTFYMYLTPTAAPDAGDTMMRVIQRY